jgi:hypothetical protein
VQITKKHEDDLFGVATIIKRTLAEVPELANILIHIEPSEA